MRSRLFSGRARRHAADVALVQATGPENLDPGFSPLRDRVAHATMTSSERMHALYQAINYAMDAGLDGDVVECGVWRGGSSMLAALALLERQDSARTLWLYDTFEGMTPPGELDVKYDGAPADQLLATQERSADAVNDWCVASLEDVHANMAGTGYPADRVRLVKGKVEETIPAEAPEAIAVLRLDTDWFESTHHELIHLYPRLVPGGVLIVDDYGWWQGAREAVDRYLADHGVCMLLTRIDDTGRMGVKPQNA
jgi:O-methyltransferase